MTLNYVYFLLIFFKNYIVPSDQASTNFMVLIFPICPLEPLAAVARDATNGALQSFAHVEANAACVSRISFQGNQITVGLRHCSHVLMFGLSHDFNCFETTCC
jgi:hypothetical protein